jgi:1,2-diacylglycerol 3-beta-glucosyltransferase
VFQVVNAATLFVMSVAAAYFFLAAGLGVRELRRGKTPLGYQAALGYGHPWQAPSTEVPDDAGHRGDDLSGWELYVLVPCLNEEAVIGATVAALADPGGRAHVVVVDDGSDDATAARAIAAAASWAPDDTGRTRLEVLTRHLPAARQGKGAALNFGFAHVAAQARARDLDPDRVIVVVMDADGWLSDGAMAEVLPCFDDDRVAGVQLAVRIRNRSDNVLLQFQDHQFWTLSALTQFGRVGTGTVSLGGNGQFTRLAALAALGPAPWSESLTEDLDLAVSLAIRGWLLTSTPRASVDQQGVGTVAALIRQRTRWYQGHMVAGRRLGQVLRSDRMSHAASLEMALYLLVPWLFDLPWSILYHLVLVEMILDAGRLQLVHGGPVHDGGTVALLYVLGFWPALVTAALARRRSQIGWLHSLVLGHCFVATNYLSYICVWRALSRIVWGRHDWVKTVRSADAPVPALRSATPS